MFICRKKLVILNKDLIETTQFYIGSKIKIEKMRAAHAFKIARALLLKG